jgi:hypothetical protein
MTMDASVFLQRAAQLSFIRDHVRKDPYPSATALLAVHSAIALNDAVLTVLTGSPYKGQDHGQAVSRTRSRCNEEKLDTDGIKHLANLVKRKTDIAYGNRETTFDEALKLSMDAERFETWAYKLLKKKGVTPQAL